MRPTPSNLISLLSDDDQPSAPPPHPQSRLTNTYKAPPRYVYDRHSGSLDKKQSLGQDRNKALQIYDIGTKKQASKPNNEKSFRCKICAKKVTTQGNIFKCQRCSKYCHSECMKQLSECPRCKFNWTTHCVNKSKINPPSEKPPINEVMMNFQHKNSPTDKESCNLATQDQAIDFGVLSNDQKKQAKQFIRKYPRCVDQNNNIRVPIDDSLIRAEPFLQELLKQQIKPLPEFQELPEYFEDLVFVWNFYASFECFLQAKQICKYSIQNFEEHLKTDPFSEFISPLLQLICQAPKLLQPDTLFRIFEDLNENKMLGFVCKYFWTIVLTSVLTNRKEKIDDKSKKLIQKLQQIFDKRSYEVDLFQDRIEILKFTICLAEESQELKVKISNCIKRKTEDLSKKNQSINLELQRIKNQRKNLAQRAALIQQKSTKLKESLPTQRSEDLVNQLKIIQSQKLKNLAFQEELKERNKNIRQYLKIREEIAEFSGFCKIKYMGRDRDDRLYWYFTQASEPNMLFLTEESRARQGFCPPRWGFYYGSTIENLNESLNRSSINQSRLKANLEKLVTYRNLIKTYSSQKYSLLKQDTSSEYQVTQFQQKINTFLEETVEEINLSELRQVLIEIRHIYGEYIEQNNLEWGENDFYQQKTRTEKFRNLTAIKNFALEFADSIYELKNEPTGKTKGRPKKKTTLIWANRPNIQFAWKKEMKNASKNPEVFMLVLILYLEVANAVRNKPGETRAKKSQSKMKKSVTSSPNSNSLSSWSVSE